MAPWAAVAAITLWPQKGVVALLLRNRHEQRMKELERGATHKELLEAAKRRSQQQPLLPQQTALPPHAQESDDEHDDN